jgi:hypothetical protein
MTTLSVAAVVQSANVPPRVQVTVTDTGTSPAITSATVTRTDAVGNVSTVRTTDGAPLVLTTSGSNRVGTVYDVEAPYGVAVTYSTVEQPANTSGAVTVAASVAWLVHPGIPDRSMPITVGALGSRARKVTRGVFYPLGRISPVVITDGQRKGVESDLSVVTFTDADRRALGSLIDDASVLMLNIPASKGWGIDSCYVSVGDVQEDKLSRLASEPGRTWKLPYVVVDRPAGGTQAQWSWSDVIAKYATWQALKTADTTWAKVQTG